MSQTAHAPHDAQAQPASLCRPNPVAETGQAAQAPPTTEAAQPVMQQQPAPPSPPPAHTPTTPAEAARRLRTMKRVALGLLLAAAAGYLLAHTQRGAHPAWGYAAAFCEAAMIGALADWFAVVALFRHPLGLPIPHTAILPRKKDRLGAQLADFLCRHFLATDQVLRRLRALDAPTRLAHWLTQPAHAQRFAQHALEAVRWALARMDDDARLRHKLAHLALHGLRHVDLAPLAGQLLAALTQGQRHQGAVTLALHKLAAVMDDTALQETLTDAIAQEIKALRYVGLDQVAARLTTRKLVAVIARTLHDMAADEKHRLRERFDGFVAELAQRLRSDPALADKAHALREHLLAQPRLAAHLGRLWDDLLDWLHADLAQPGSQLRQHLAQAAQALGQRLQHDPALRESLQNTWLGAAPPLIERYREDIRQAIVARVQAWDAADMTAELERHIGRDLQFIRINGTLVGGLAGLSIYSLTQWLGR